MKTLISVLLLLSFIRIAHAQTAPATSGSADELLKSLDYPELQVVPSASDRLAMEAEGEKANWLYINWPVTLSSATTLMAANMVKGNYGKNVVTAEDQSRAENIVQVAQILGAGGLVLGLGLPVISSYGAGLAKVRAIKGNDRRAQLLRERLSEEVLERQAHYANLVRWASSSANLAISLAMMERADENQSKFAALAALASVVPMVLRPSQVVSYEKHQEYKRKIYSPVTDLDLLWDPSQGSWQPVTTLTWRF